jgi:hypothetical protein
MDGGLSLQHTSSSFDRGLASIIASRPLFCTQRPNLVLSSHYNPTMFPLEISCLCRCSVVMGCVFRFHPATRCSSTEASTRVSLSAILLKTDALFEAVQLCSCQTLPNDEQPEKP